MQNKRHLIFSFLLLGMLSACSTQPVNQPVADSARAVASKDQGITSYPSAATFDLKANVGKTYVSFMKSKVKPALDKLGDKANGGGGGFDNIGAGHLRSRG